MSVSGNEIGDLLVDIGLITPEELANAHSEQIRTGERLTLVLEKLGLVSHNQLKDALELQFGVNYVSLAKHPPEREILDLLSDELRRKHKVLPIAQNGTQFTLAMVDPDDAVALDAVRMHLKSGQLKKVVCTADDFEFTIARLETPANAPLTEVQESKPAARETPIPAKPLPETNLPKAAPKVPARKSLQSLFGDDDDDDDFKPLKQPKSPPAKVETPPAAQSTVSATIEAEAPIAETPKVEARLEAPEASKEAAPADPKSQPSEAKLYLADQPPEALLSLPEIKLESIESVVAQVTTHLVETASPIRSSLERQFLEEVLESEFDGLDLTAPELLSPSTILNTDGELSSVLDKVLGEQSKQPGSDSSLLTAMPATLPPEALAAEASVNNATTIDNSSACAITQENVLPFDASEKVSEAVSKSRTVPASNTVNDHQAPPAQSIGEAQQPAVLTGTHTAADTPAVTAQATPPQGNTPAAAPAPQSQPAAPGPPANPILGLANEIIGKATQQNCSEIHLEPDGNAVILRYFIHGEMLADCRLPLQIHKPLVGSYKSMAGLDPEVTGKPQDRRFTKTVGEKEIEMRVTTLPSDHGEMVAISLKVAD